VGLEVVRGAWVALAAPAVSAEMERAATEGLAWCMEAFVEGAVDVGSEVTEVVEGEAAEDSWAHGLEAMEGVATGTEEQVGTAGMAAGQAGPVGAVATAS